MQQTIKGSALISALFIMTLVAIAATSMSSRLQLDIYKTRMNITKDKLYLASEFVTFWAMEELSKKKHPSLINNNPNGRVLQLPKTLHHIYPNTLLTGEVIDLQAFFNLNGLQKSSNQIAFLNLLKKTHNHLTEEENQHILRAVGHWVHNQSRVANRDEFLDLYVRQKPPYYSAYQPMKNVSELRLIDTITPKLYQALEPNICVLPEATPININTANATILMLLGNGLTSAQATELIQLRGKQGIEDLKAIDAWLQKLDIAKEDITIESNYFLSIATASTAELQMTNASVLKRELSKSGKMTMTVLSEVLS